MSSFLEYGFVTKQIKNGNYYEIEAMFGLRKYIIRTTKEVPLYSLIKVNSAKMNHQLPTIPLAFNQKFFYLGQNVFGRINQYQKIEVAFNFNILNYKKLDLFYDYLDFNTDVLFKTLYFSSFYYIMKKLIYHFSLDKYENKLNIILTILLLFLFGFHYYLVYKLITIAIKSTLTNKFELENYEITTISLMILLMLYPYLIFNQGFIIFLIYKLLYLFKLKTKLKPLIVLPFCFAWYKSISLYILIKYPLYSLFYFIFIFIELFIPSSFYPSITESINSLDNSLIFLNNISITYIKVSLTFFIIYYILLLILMTLKTNLKKTIVIVVIAFFIIIYPSTKYYKYNDFAIFVDCGQGDTAIIKKNNKIIVVDAFNSSYEFLINHGFNHIDYLLLTHNHEDHIKEAATLISKLKVKTLILNAFDDYNLFHPNTILVDKPFEIPEIQLQMLGPLIKSSNPNNNSLFFQLTITNKTILFTGDIEKEAEKLYIQTYNQKLKSDILKVSHHGSDTSTTTEFIRKVKPEISIISVAKNNSYNLPSNQVINNLIRHGSKVYQTSLNGSFCINYRYFNYYHFYQKY